MGRDKRRAPTRPRAAKDRGPTPTLTRARAAEGRERAVVETGVSSGWLTLALDAIQRHRATAMPLDKMLAELVRARHVGAKTRRAASDALFAWARQRTVIEREIDDALAREGGVAPRRRQRDHAAVLLALLWSDLELARDDEAALPGVLAALVEAAASGAWPAPPAELPPWLAAKVARDFGDETPALVAAMMERAPVTLALDARVVDERRVLDALAALGVDASPSPLLEHAIRARGRVPLARLPRDLSAHVWPMDDGSQLVALALDVRAGELVLDLCAGGGGKTRFLVAQGARVVAADADRPRLEAAKARAAPTLALHARGEAPPFVGGTFDRVLVDAPCSGTGTLRRSPDLAARLDEGAVLRYPPLQRALLESALDLVKPGGTVVYATCSLLDEENGAVVDAVLAARPDVSAVPLTGLSRARDARVQRAASKNRAVFMPHVHGTDGFFVAALTRR